MTGRLTAQLPVILLEQFHDVAITHFGPHKIHTQRLQCQLQTVIAHQRAHDTTLQGAVQLAATGNDEQQFIAIHQLPFGIHHQHPIAITVERNPHIRAQLQYFFLQGLGMGGAAVLINIQSIRLNTNGHDFSTQLFKYGRPGRIGRTIGTVHDDAQAMQGQMPGKGAFTEFDVATPGILKLFGFANPVRRHRIHFPAQLGLNGQLHLIGQFFSFRAEKLDAIIVIGVMGRTDDNAGGSPVGARQIGDGRCWHGPQQHDVHTGCR